MSDVVFWTFFGLLGYFILVFAVLVAIDLVKRHNRRKTTLRWGKDSDIRLYRTHIHAPKNDEVDWKWPEGVGTDERE